MFKVIFCVLCQLGLVSVLLGATPSSPKGNVMEPIMSQLSKIEKPSLTISFDQDLNGIDQNGKVVKGVPIKNPILVPGKFGKALQSGPLTGYVQYPSQNILNTTMGTVEMWISPVDWKSGNLDRESHHVFFDAQGEGALVFYKFSSMSCLLMEATSHQGAPKDLHSAPMWPVQFATNPINWKTGQWYHIAGTWSPRGVQVYVNGKTFHKNPLRSELPRGNILSFIIGDQPWYTKRTSSTLIEDVKIYDRVLSLADIKAHYAGNRDFSLPLTAEDSVLDFRIDPDTQVILPYLKIGATNITDTRMQVKCTIVPAGQDFSGKEFLLTLNKGFASGIIPIPAPGKYTLIARVHLDGKKMFDINKDITIPKNEWLGNKLGLEDKVLPPWTPMETKGNDVYCWGRNYTFGEGALPKQIVAADKALLARPISFLAFDNDKKLPEKLGKLHFDSISETKVKTASSRTIGNVKLTTTATTEYDGLILFETKADNLDQASFNRLSLEIPVKSEHALYYYFYKALQKLEPSGNIPAGSGSIIKTSWLPYAWLGDNDRGLFWFCESDEMWPNRAAPNAIEIIRNGDEVTLRLNILASGQKMPEDWNFVFGLQATPVKPMPKNWRKWRLNGLNKNVQIVWCRGKNLTAFGYPQASNPQKYKKLVEGYQSKGIKFVPYLGLTYISENMPETIYFRKHWDAGTTDPYVTGNSDKFTPWYQTAPASQSFSDFMAWKTKKFIERYKIDGLYHDQTHPYISNRLESGAGYEKDGIRYRTYPIMAYRSLYRRIYAILKSQPQETFSLGHMSAKMNIPVLAYEDGYLNGEHLASQLKTGSYVDTLPLDVFRASYMGRQWGVAPFFLPEFRDKKFWRQKEPSTELLAMLMVHDVNFWRLWINKDVANKAYYALDKFGYVESKFIPYFDSVPPAKTQMKEIYISAYKRADNRVLLVLANLSKERQERTGKVHINFKRLDITPDKLLNWPDGKPLEMVDGTFEITVPARGYRLIVIQGK